MSVNPLGVELLPENDEGEELCVICQDVLGVHPTYTLPECGHKYHTHCIVTWFRHRPSSQDYGNEDGRCPMCGNQGINNIGGGQTRPRYNRRRRSRHLGSQGEKVRYKVIMREAKKPDAPRDLIKLTKKHSIAKDSYAVTEASLKALKERIKTEPVNYAETAAQMRKLNRELWRKARVVEGCQQAITWFPIVPIIIPTPVDIN